MNGSEDVLVYLHSSIIAKLFSAFPKVSPIDSNVFWTKFLRLLKSDVYNKHMSKGPLNFIVNFDATATGTVNYLDPVSLNEYFLKRSSSNILYIDVFGNNFEPNPFSSEKLQNLEEVAESSQSNNYLYVFVKGVELKITHKQVILKDIPDFYSLNKVGHIKSLLPIDEYRKLLDKHYETEIKGERGIEYWQNKAKYELVAAPENKFRKKLANFLENNLSGGFIDEECRNNNTNDRNDVRVITVPNHEVHIIEIKWVGKSIGNNYDGTVAHVKANEGLEQLNLYIDGEPRCVSGILLIYDARKDQESFKWNKATNTWKENISNPPVVLHLDPTSSSERAKEIVKTERND
ncbi:hypothetical protein ASU31_18860 [Pedobacter ginsenosidimutans]|uniref:Uncharacterized protein n=1 Tax=Pedobacter ginsenosidimutans TaxID=687842 RepID=A0A0T5VKU4_9SPHI|nr:hypothetical protein [Pedobacter ginsenosidimutans]KRT14488.1 hypothetical protein ASU31_18860 [Pedobacter ginsenosidimutans]